MKINYLVLDVGYAQCFSRCAKVSMFNHRYTRSVGSTVKTFSLWNITYVSSGYVSLWGSNL
jgi:hypothetical protein